MGLLVKVGDGETSVIVSWRLFCFHWCRQTGGVVKPCTTNFGFGPRILLQYLLSIDSRKGVEDVSAPPPTEELP